VSWWLTWCLLILTWTRLDTRHRSKQWRSGLIWSLSGLPYHCRPSTTVSPVFGTDCDAGVRSSMSAWPQCDGACQMPWLIGEFVMPLSVLQDSDVY